MGLITNLISGRVACVGLGNAYTWSLGYVIVKIQVDGVQGYDEDQISLVVPDLLNFMEKISIILGTTNISHIMNVMKEREIDALAMLWANARVAHLLPVQRVAATRVDDQTMEESSPDEYDKVVITKNTDCGCMWEHINSMTQVLQTKDGSLPQGLTIQNAYTKLRKGSKNAVVVVRNSMAFPQTLKKKTVVARVVATTVVSEPPAETRLPEGEDEPQSLYRPKLTVRQRQGKLFEKLDLSGLELWPPELAESTCWLLAEYHDVFSMEPAKLGCIHSTEHTIKVTDDTPFKEWFRWIPTPLVEEVCNHFREMLESGAIWPSQSAWCNMVVLVRKKDGGLCFCIDFCHLNACTEKDSYPLPRIQEAL